MAEQFFSRQHFELKNHSQAEVYGFNFDSLSKLDREAYLRRGVDIAASAFRVAQIDHGFEQDVEEHLQNHDVMFLDVQGESVAFASLQHITHAGQGVMYIAGLVVKEPVQDNGVAQILAKEAKAQYEAIGQPVDYIAGRTQNPVVARARGAYCHEMYPILHTPTQEIVYIGHQLRDLLGMSGVYDEETLISRNAYGSPLIRKPSGDERIDQFFDTHIGPRDAVFIIGQPNF